MQKDLKWVIRAEYNLSSHLSRVAGLKHLGQGFCVSEKVESRVSQFSLSANVIESS